MKNYRYLRFYWSFNSKVFTKNKINTLLEVPSQNQKYNIKVKFNAAQYTIYVESVWGIDLIHTLTIEDIKKVYSQSHVLFFQIDLRKGAQGYSQVVLAEVVEEITDEI